MAIFFRKAKTTPKKLVISRTDRIGDFMLTLPVFERIKQELDISLVLLCQDLTAPLAKNNPYIDEVIAINPKYTPKKAAGLILAHEPDGLLVMVNDPFIRTVLPMLHSIPFRMGPLSKMGMVKEFTHPVRQKRSRSIHNEAYYNLELLEGLGLKGGFDIKPKLYYSQQEQDSFLGKLMQITPSLNLQQRYIVFHAGMSGSALNWPRESYKELLGKLLAQGLQVVLSGQSAEEKELNAYLMEGLSEPNRVIDCTGMLTLRELGLMMAMSALFIGPSTGPTHVANGVGCPIVSFYPPIQVQSQTRWEPYLADAKIFVPEVNCPAKYKCKGASCKYYECMPSISVEEVYQGCLEKMR